MIELFKRKNKKTVEDYYAPKLKNGTQDFEILGWESEEAHLGRFEILVKHINLHGKSVFDVGCGLGTLYDFLKNNEIETAYTGIDILQDMIEKAIERNPEAEFACCDILAESDFNSVDVVYASGIFNLKQDNNSGFIKKAMDVFLNIADEAVVFNLLHTNSKNREDMYFYTNPEQMTTLLQEFTGRFSKVQFFQSYLENDFTVIIRK